MKRYADEPGAETVRALPSPVVCALARVEVPAAIWRKHRLGELSGDDASVLVEAFERDWVGDADAPGVFAVVAVGAAVLEVAARTVARHPLRAYDAVQLGAALAARSADADLRSFACFDAQLGAAARAEGFRVISCSR